MTVEMFKLPALKFHSQSMKGLWKRWLFLSMSDDLWFQTIFWPRNFQQPDLWSVDIWPIDVCGFWPTDIWPLDVWSLIGYCAPRFPTSASDESFSVDRQVLQSSASHFDSFQNFTRWNFCPQLLNFRCPQGIHSSCSENTITE